MTGTVVTGYNYHLLASDIINSRDTILEDIGKVLVDLTVKNIISNGLVKSGELRDSIKFRIDDGTLILYSDVDYAAIHEFGGRIRINDAMRSVLHYKGIHVTKKRKFIIMPARPFMRPAVDQIKSMYGVNITYVM